MTDLPFVPFAYEEPVERPALARPKPHRHRWLGETCATCGRTYDRAAAKRGRTNRSRGNREELTVARLVGGRKVGPMGWPWDVEGDGFRLQVKKLAERPSINAIALLIQDIPYRSDSLRGFVWVTASGQGRRASRVVYVSNREWIEWHGVSSPGYPGADLLMMSLEDFTELHCREAT